MDHTSGYDSDDLQFVDDLNLDAELSSHDVPELSPLGGHVEADSTTDIKQEDGESQVDNLGDGDIPVADNMEVDIPELQTDGQFENPETPPTPDQSEHIHLFTASISAPDAHPYQSDPSTTEVDTSQPISAPDVTPFLSGLSTPGVLPSQTVLSTPGADQIADDRAFDDLNGERRTRAAEPEAETKPAPKQRFVKHIIEGFLIEESAKAFPVHRSSLLTELIPKSKITRKRVNPKCYLRTAISNQGRSRNNTPTSTRVNTPEPTEHGTDNTHVGTYICTRCSKVCGALLKFYRSEPYCSKKCIIQFKRALMDELGIKPKRGRPAKNRPSLHDIHSELSTSTLLGSPHHSHVELSSPIHSYKNFSSYYIPIIKPGTGQYVKPGAGVIYNKNDVLHWTVDDVKLFIQSLDGCARYCGEFVEQEIDGRALLLLTQDILLNALEMQLKPAMTIYSHITTLLI